MAKKRDIYLIDGKEARSVSAIKGILDKPFLLYWAVKKATEFLEEKWQPDTPYSRDMIESLLDEAKRQHTLRKSSAGEFGTDKHDLVGSYIGGQLQPDDVQDPSDRKILENFIKVTTGWQWLASEIPLSNKELGYGGTADALAYDENGLLILPDVKTSNFVGADVSIQLALYALALPNDRKLHELWEEMRKIGEGRILHLNKERLTWEVLERPLIPHYPFMPAFCQCHEWRARFDKR